jgi:hypothetical protein
VAVEGEAPGASTTACLQRLLKTHDGQATRPPPAPDWSSLHLDLIADRGLKRLAASLYDLGQAFA